MGVTHLAPNPLNLSPRPHRALAPTELHAPRAPNGLVSRGLNGARVNRGCVDDSLPHCSRRQREPLARLQPQLGGREQLAQGLEAAGVRGRLHHASAREAGLEEPLGEHASAGRRLGEYALQPRRQRCLRLARLCRCVDHKVVVLVELGLELFEVRLRYCKSQIKRSGGVWLAVPPDNLKVL